MSNDNKDISELLNKIKSQNSTKKNEDGSKNPNDLPILYEDTKTISENILDELIADLERLNLEIGESIEQEDIGYNNEDYQNHLADEMKMWEWALAQEKIMDSLIAEDCGESGVKNGGSDDEDDDIYIQVPPEFFDIIKVMELGAMKYGADSYLDSNNKSMQHKNNTASMFRHLAEHHMGVDKDVESGVDPLLHLACRALMAYTRKQRGIFEDE